MTTEENSYGFAKKAWFDGAVEVANWVRGDDVKLQITDVTEYQYLKATCSKESFYQCLANRFSRITFDDLKKYEVWYRNKNYRCENLERLCLPISLPSTLPTCNNTEPGFFIIGLDKIIYILLERF